MDYRNPDDLRALLCDSNDVQIAHMFGVTDRTIRNWRSKFNIEPSSVPHRGSTKDFTLNRSFFRSIDTPEKAYVLGFIATDGSVHRNGKSLSIAITESDVDLLYAIRDVLGGTNEIHAKCHSGGYPGSRPLAVLHVCSVELVRDLATYGIVANKSLVLCYPFIHPHLEAHFIRGLYDGDGYIGNRQFHIVGTSSLLTGIQSAVHRHLGQSLSHRVDSVNTSRLVGYRRNQDVLAWMYDNATITLKRKQEKYKLFWFRPSVPSL